MTARIYTAAEAESLLAGTTPGPWRTYGNAAHDDAPSDAWSIAHDGITLAEAHADDRPQYDEDAAEVVEADADLMAAAPDLAASVAFHARRAEKAEADLTVADDRASDAEAESAAAEAALVAVWQAVTDDDLPRLPSGDGTVVDAEAVGRRVAAVVAERDKGRTYLEQRAEILVSAFSSTVRGVLDAIGARDREVPLLTLTNLAAWLATETRLVVDDLAMTRDNRRARATRAEAEVARLTAALTAQTARADGAEAEALRLTQERDAMRAIIEGRTTPPTDAEARSHFAAGGSFADCGHLTRGRAFSLFDLAFAKAAVETSGRPARWWALDASDRPCAWPVVAEVTQ